MADLNHRHITSLLDDYDVFLFDLWGVIVEGDATYPGVVDQINKIIMQKKVYFVSNAPRPDYKLLPRLASFGFENIDKEMIVTSGDVARKIIEESRVLLAKDDISIFHLGKDRNDDILHNVKHRDVDNLDDADIFLLSIYRDEEEDIHEFDQILKDAAARDLIIICSNPDTTIPKHGITRYCAGYFADIIEKHGGNVIYTGKPGKEIYEVLLEREQDIPKNRILMIGDTFETDILGGQNVGIHSALVLTGNSIKHHKDFDSLANKLSALQKKADELGIYPTYVTSI